MNSGFPVRQFFLLYSPVALLILAGAWFLGSDRIAGELSLIRANEINNVVMGVRRLDDELRVPVRQLRALKEARAVRGALDAPDSEAPAAMADAFAVLMGYNQAIARLRWLDESGRERVRVEDVAGKATATPPERLQDLAGSDYFKAAMALPPDAIHMSPLGLEVESGAVVMPPKPLLHLAARVHDGGGQARGVLVVDIAARGLLDAFREGVVEARDHAMLVNQAGYWLASPDPAQDWGFALPHKESLAASAPGAWKAVSAIPSGQEEQPDGLWTWSTVYPIRTGTDNRIVDPQAWLVIAHLPDNQLAIVRERAWTQAAVLGGVLLLLFGLLGAWLARAQTGWTQAEIAAAKAQVEAAAAKRLGEVLKRFRLMVEANSNGLVVVNRDGLIVLANPALERMFGYGKDELLGQRLDMLLREDERRLHGDSLSAYMRSPEARPMGSGRDLHGRRKDGSAFPIEVSLSPFTEDGEQFVDALVADISERKRRAEAS